MIYFFSCTCVRLCAFWLFRCKGEKMQTLK